MLGRSGACTICSDGSERWVFLGVFFFGLRARRSVRAGGGLQAESGGQVMHEGVLRDDTRRAAKLREREEALRASREKQRTYESVQRVEGVQRVESGAEKVANGKE